MRVDRSTYPNVPWLVWHVPTCREIKRVMWVDDEAMQVTTADLPYRFNAAGQLAVTVHQHDRVVVRPQAALILVDPLDDDEPAVGRVAVELVADEAPPAATRSPDVSALLSVAVLRAPGLADRGASSLAVRA